MQELIRSGHIPDIKKADEIIEGIDTRAPIFTHNTILSGDTFNVEAFNQEMQLIADDLKISYQVFNEIAVKKFNELQEYTNVHLNELQCIANKYEYRNLFETSSSSLGKTVLFKADNFDVTIDNDIAIVHLGEQELTAGSQIACFFNSDVVDNNNVTFDFGDISCSPYTINKDTFNVPGDKNIKTYECNIDTSTIVNSDYKMDIEKFIPNNSYDYVIYSGKNKIETHDGYEDIFVSSAKFYDHPTRIKFYVLDASYIKIDTSKTPLSYNYKNNIIDKPEHSQQISMEVPENTMLTVDTDGVIYAEKEKGYIYDGELYYPSFRNMNTYLIEEYDKTKKISYENITVTIRNIKTDYPFSVNSIALKEI